MFCLGEKNPVVQLVQGSPLQLEVLPGEQLLFSVGQTTHVRLEHTPVTIVQHGDAKLSQITDTMCCSAGVPSYLRRLIRSRARPCIMLISSLGMVTSS